MKITIKETCKRLEARAVKHLRNAYHDSQYILERATCFFSTRDQSDCLAGDRKLIGSDVTCTPIRFTGKALLVSVFDTTGKAWFAWIHA